MMNKKDIKKILVPVTLGENSKRLLSFAIEFAKAFDARIKAIHVVHDFADYTLLPFPLDALSELKNSFIEEAQQRLDEMLNDIVKDKEDIVETQVLIGDAVIEILEFSKEYNPDLIIMGTKTHKGFEKLIYGSVAQGVFSKSSVPVMLVNPEGKIPVS